MSKDTDFLFVSRNPKDENGKMNFFLSKEFKSLENTSLLSKEDVRSYKAFFSFELAQTAAAHKNKLHVWFPTHTNFMSKP